MNYRPLPLSGAVVLVPKVHADERGYFKEIFSAPRYGEAGVGDAFVQDNVSYSKRGVIRGLHGDPRMAKLVQVLRGTAFDVMVDLRRASPTYLQWYGARLDADEHTQIYIPAGFLHGFLALSDEVVFLYKQTATYDPATEFGVAWNDPDLGIDWPLDGLTPQLSTKDASNPTLRELGYV